MSVSRRPPIPSLIPESAPFTAEQRTWLNGLFAGLFGLPENVRRCRPPTPPSFWQDCSTARLVQRSRRTMPRKPTMAPLGTTRRCRCADRMKLAEGKPLPRRLMAAMAQQDCGQCGYNCKDYADALFAKSRSG